VLHPQPDTWVSFMTAQKSLVPLASAHVTLGNGDHLPSPRIILSGCGEWFRRLNTRDYKSSSELVISPRMALGSSVTQASSLCVVRASCLHHHHPAQDQERGVPEQGFKGTDF